MRILLFALSLIFVLCAPVLADDAEKSEAKTEAKAQEETQIT